MVHSHPGSAEFYQDPHQVTDFSEAIDTDDAATFRGPAFAETTATMQSLAYNASLKDRVRLAVEKAYEHQLRGKGNVVAELHNLLAEFPGSLVIETMRESDILDGYLSNLEEITGPRMNEIEDEYRDASAPRFWSRISPKERQLFHILFVKNRKTFEHSIQTYFLAQAYAAKNLGGMQDAWAPFLVDAGLDHDLGKINTPEIVFCNPFTRDQQPALWASWMTKEGYKITDVDERPVEMGEEEWERFAPLFTGEPVRNHDLLRDFIRYAKSRQMDFKKIPLKYLLNVARRVDLLQDFDLGPQLWSEQLRVSDKILRTLRAHSSELGTIDEVLENFGLGKEGVTFLDALLQHAEISAELIMGAVDNPDENRRIVAHTVSQHHHVPGRPDIAHDEMEKALIEGLKMVDVTAALSQNRPYHSGLHSVEQVRRILEWEVSRGHLDSRISRSFIGTFLDRPQDQGRTDVLSVILDRV